VESLVFDSADVCDPKRCCYGFGRFHPASVEGWRLGMRLVLRAGSLELPPDWLRDAAGYLAADGGAACDGPAPALALIRGHGTRGLAGLARALGGEARAHRTMLALRTPAFNALWWLASRGHGVNPPPPAAFRLYLAFLADLRASQGAVETASQAFSLLARTSGWPPGAMDGAARIPVDTSAALHPSTAALTILRRILCPRPVGTSQARRGSAAKRGPGQCAEAPRCRARGLRRGSHSLEAPPRSAPGWSRGPPSPGEDTGRGASAPHVGRSSQVKSGIALRETWSRRQAGAMRLVRRAGWVWAARTIQNHHTPCPQESPVVLTPAG
jgi:hypothetical protein